MIEVKHSAGAEWVVSIKSTVTTHHRVRVTKKDVERLAGGRLPEELLQESFRFLLENEPNTSILPSFDLPVIGHYFPEYEREIQAWLKQFAYKRLAHLSGGRPSLAHRADSQHRQLFGYFRVKRLSSSKLNCCLDRTCPFSRDGRSVAPWPEQQREERSAD